jgi:hypothetical protein
VNGAAGAGTNTGRRGLLSGFGCAIRLLLCAAGTSEIRDNAKPANADRAFFCSELGARCFELAGAPVVKAQLRSPLRATFESRALSCISASS